MLIEVLASWVPDEEKFTVYERILQWEDRLKELRSSCISVAYEEGVQTLCSVYAKCEISFSLSAWFVGLLFWVNGPISVCGDIHFLFLLLIIAPRRRSPSCARSCCCLAVFRFALFG